MEDTPDTAPDGFRAVRGRRAKQHAATGEVWELDRLHRDHWEVYKSLGDYEHGVRARSVWSDGRLKQRF